jgi:hypothetical protein
MSTVLPSIQPYATYCNGMRNSAMTNRTLLGVGYLKRRAVGPIGRDGMSTDEPLPWQTKESVVRPLKERAASCGRELKTKQMSTWGNER